MATKKAFDILKRCEQDLRAAMQQAAQDGDYDRLLQITRWAQSVAGMANEARVTTGSEVARSVSVASAKKAHSEKRNKGDYPRFARRGDLLIKIGWSKKEKKEYQHKSPVQVAELLCNVLLRIGGKSKILSTDDLFPLREKDGSEAPVSQSYVCLAWLKAEELIIQEGRLGYRITDPSTLADALQSSWRALSEV